MEPSGRAGEWRGLLQHLDVRARVTTTSDFRLATVDDKYAVSVTTVRALGTARRDRTSGSAGGLLR